MNKDCLLCNVVRQYGEIVVEIGLNQGKIIKFGVLHD